MKTSLIIPALNAETRLVRLLEAVRNQTLKPDEILIADSESEDGTTATAISFGAEVLPIRRSEFDHGGTRTFAGRHASGDVIIYMTDDAVPADSGAFEALLKTFETPGVGAAYGRQVPHAGADVFGRALRAFNYTETSYVRTLRDRAKYGIKTPFLSNSFAAYSRSALERIGWFKDGLILGEDTYAGAKLLQAGYSLAYEPRAVVCHSHNYSAWQDFKRYFDIGVFHREERWILETFGRAEGEGLKFVTASLEFLKENSAVSRVPEFFLRTVLKYLGYKLGTHYNMLGGKAPAKLSMHPGWWK